MSAKRLYEEPWCPVSGDYYATGTLTCPDCGHVLEQPQIETCEYCDAPKDIGKPCAYCRPATEDSHAS